MRDKLLTLLLVACLGMGLRAQTPYVPTPENLKAREEFQDNKFGIFLHWGLYAMLARGEWVMFNDRIEESEYAKLAAGFCPSRFNADEWVATIKESGARYICLTSRHHEGFSMFKTAQSDYNIVDATPFGRDVLKELADACARHGIKLHLYYSHLDWHLDYPKGHLQRNVSDDKSNWPGYYAFMNNQLTELLTNYGPIGAIWFDGQWSRIKADWQLAEQYALIHRLQPACLIGNNHHIAPFPGEDLQIFERDLPGQNTFGGNTAAISDLLLEDCELMSHKAWGYDIHDLDFKSVETLVQLLVRAAGLNSNLLLNIGPRPDGKLPDGAVARLKEIGQWMQQYGETIYGTRGGPVAPHDWGVTTQKGNRLFVHILNLQDSSLFIPIEAKKVKQAVRFKDGSRLNYTRLKDGIVLQLGEAPGDIDHVVELTLAE